MTITSIERQRHNTERFSIFIDGEFAFGMSGVDVLYYKLEEGLALTPARYSFLVDEVLYMRARAAVLRFLGYRARTRREIMDKLDEYPAAVVEKILDMLENDGYVDDTAFARDYAETRARAKGCGKRRIASELRAKGVEPAVIDEVLTDMDFDETAAAVRKLERKAKGQPVEGNDKRRMTDYLMRQGFSYDTIKDAFRAYETFDDSEA